MLLTLKAKRRGGSGTPATYNLQWGADTFVWGADTLNWGA